MAKAWSVPSIFGCCLPWLNRHAGKSVPNTESDPGETEGTRKGATFFQYVSVLWISVEICKPVSLQLRTSGAGGGVGGQTFCQLSSLHAWSRKKKIKPAPALTGTLWVGEQVPSVKHI